MSVSPDLPHVGDPAATDGAACAAPIALNPMLIDESEALLATVTLPLAAPVEAGANETLSVAV